MRIFINEQPLDLPAGLTVRQALTQAGLLKEIEKGARVFDAWGNEVGLDGSLEEGARLTLKQGS